MRFRPLQVVMVHAVFVDEQSTTPIPVPGSRKGVVRRLCPFGQAYVTLDQQLDDDGFPYALAAADPRFPRDVLTRPECCDFLA